MYSVDVEIYLFIDWKKVPLPSYDSNFETHHAMFLFCHSTLRRTPMKKSGVSPLDFKLEAPSVNKYTHAHFPPLC